MFILLNCWRGLMQARVLARIAKLPRRGGFACPSCGQAPIIGPLWRCDKCLKPFDTFETRATCPHCGAQFPGDALPGVRPVAFDGGVGGGGADVSAAEVVGVRDRLNLLAWEGERPREPRLLLEPALAGTLAHPASSLPTGLP